MGSTTVNIHEAKTQLSKLVDAAAAGETVIIAKSGRPVARLVRIDATYPAQRVGFLVGYGSVPDDFDEFAAEEIADLFEGRPQ
jgi:prevent-host-death family protein